MSGPFRLATGTRLCYQGREYELVERRVGSAALRDLESAELVDVSLETLLGAPDFEPLQHESSGEWPLSVALDLVPPKAMELAERRAAELLEADTGYRSGDRAAAEPDEPRPEYDPSLVASRDERFANKAAELARGRTGPKITKRQLWRWRRAYEEKGVLGLVDQRHLPARDPFAGYEQYVDVLRREIDAETGRSRKTRDKILHDAARKAREQHGEEARVPGRTKAYELHRILTPNQPENTPTRRSAAGRGTPALNPLKASRPGEVVQLDATRADILVVDPVSGRIGRPEFGLAVDAYSRTLLGARIQLTSSDGVDAALLLHDIVTPKRSGPGWAPEARWSYAGVPREIVVDLGKATLNGAEPAGIPFVWPDTVVIDQGRIYTSKTFLRGCEQLKISVQPAPPRTPNYKGIVERFFRSLNTGLLQYLPGHTGENVLARGERPEADKLLFVHELEALFFEYIATCYHRRPNEGCRMAGVQGRELSPNEMFEQGLARAGFIMAVPDPDWIIGLLPPSWRKVRPERGVRIDDVFYWDDCLIKWLDRDSPYPQEPAKHPIHVDPRDRSRVWFHDPEEGSWHELRRLGAEEPDLPFHEDLIHWSKRRLVEAGEDGRDPDRLAEMLDDVLRRHTDGRPLDPGERRILGEMEIETRQAARDLRPRDVRQAAEQIADEGPADDGASGDGWEEAVDPLGVME